MKEQEEQKDLKTQGNEDILKGKLKEAGGKAQSKYGELTKDKEAQARGKAKEFEGKTQSTLGKGERKLDDALNQDERTEP